MPSSEGSGRRDSRSKIAAHAFSVLDSFIYGFVVQELSLPFGNSEERAQIAGAILQDLPADAYPHLIEMTTEHVLQPGYDSAIEYEFGLDLILEGLEKLCGT